MHMIISDVFFPFLIRYYIAVLNAKRIHKSQYHGQLYPTIFYLRRNGLVRAAHEYGIYFVLVRGAENKSILDFEVKKDLLGSKNQVFTMRIGIVGLGYVGLSTAVVLADQGNDLVCVDIDQKRLEMLGSGISPIYEVGLEDMLKKNLSRMKLTTDYAALKGAEAIFICVPTPTTNNKFDITYVASAIKKLVEIGVGGVVVIKSTVPPTAMNEIGAMLGKRPAMNPEFLKEGTAIRDTVNPDRVVVGADSDSDFEVVRKVWEFTKAPVLKVSPEEASMIKYASNSLLAAKISFINEVANICEKLPNCDIRNVSNGIGLDRRIGREFLNAGPGYGGSCFPKDTVALSSIAKDLKEETKIVDAAISVNSARPKRIVDSLEGIMGPLSSKRVGVLGLAFKAETDDTRESVSLRIIDELVGRGAKVIAYDPKARFDRQGVTVASSMKECIDSSEGVIIATEWKEFGGIEGALVGKYVVDTRRMLKPALMDPSRFRAIGVMP